MNEVEFNQAFSKFLDDEKCELVSETLYKLIHSAFTAGWKSALSSELGKAMDIEDRRN